jgi:hypothetical protein
MKGTKVFVSVLTVDKITVMKWTLYNTQIKDSVICDTMKSADSRADRRGSNYSRYIFIQVLLNTGAPPVPALT